MVHITPRQTSLLHSTRYSFRPSYFTPWSPFAILSFCVTALPAYLLCCLQTVKKEPFVSYQAKVSFRALSATYGPSRASTFERDIYFYLSSLARFTHAHLSTCHSSDNKNTRKLRFSHRYVNNGGVYRL